MKYPHQRLPSVEVRRQLITAQRDEFLKIAYNYSLTLEALEVQEPVGGFEGGQARAKEMEAHRQFVANCHKSADRMQELLDALTGAAAVSAQGNLIQ